jgi:hypothetical protein
MEVFAFGNAGSGLGGKNDIPRISFWDLEFQLE